MNLFSMFSRRETAPDPAADLRRKPLADAIENARNPARQVSQRVSRINARRQARMMMMASADINRLTGDWPTTPVHADWIVSRFQRSLVARSREQAANNDFMKAYLRLQRLNIVGPLGIQFHSQAMKGASPDRRARTAVNAAFQKWGRAENCDVAATLSWLGFQKTAIDTVARDGEVFVRFIFGEDAGPMGVALQMIDPQRCPVEFDRTDLGDGRFIRHGIEFNRYGRPLAYYFTDDTVGQNPAAYVYNGKSYTRVPAAEILHLFVVEFPGQKRGLPWMATGLFRAKQTQAMEDAAVVNARVGAAKMGFIQFREGTGPELDEDDDLEFDAEAGTFPLLPEGAEFKEFAPQYPQGEFAVFVKQMLRAFAAGGGVSYHSLSQDLEGVNFSSIRHGTLDERESHKERQEWFRETFHDRVFAVVFPRLLLGGFVVDAKGAPLPAVKLAALSACRWQARRWSWIDPRADMDANEKAKNNMMTSVSQLIREAGGEPEQVFAEIGEDIKAMKKAGIPEAVIVAAMGQKLAAAPQAASEEPAGESAT